MLLDIEVFRQLNHQGLVGREIPGHLKWQGMLAKTRALKPRLEKFGFHLSTGLIIRGRMGIVQSGLNPKHLHHLSR
jgi:hypothetical protein